MQGMTLQTALEIFTNPRDLEFTIGQDRKSKKFGFGIFRGEGHRYKPMLTSEPFAPTLDDVIEIIKGILETAVKASISELENRSSIASQIINPDNVPINQLKVMDQNLIDRILAVLKRDQRASTCEMFVAKC
jgi:hypothetical protein